MHIAPEVRIDEYFLRNLHILGMLLMPPRIESRIKTLPGFIRIPVLPGSFLEVPLLEPGRHRWTLMWMMMMCHLAGSWGPECRHWTLRLSLWHSRVSLVHWTLVDHHWGSRHHGTRWHHLLVLGPRKVLILHESGIHGTVEPPRTSRHWTTWSEVHLWILVTRWTLVLVRIVLTGLVEVGTNTTRTWILLELVVLVVHHLRGHVGGPILVVTGVLRRWTILGLVLERRSRHEPRERPGFLGF